jgi:charged multivesicular body protein 4
VIHHDRNIDDVDKTIDDINEQTESLKQIQDALSTPFDMGIDIDEVLVTFLL